MFKKPLTVLNNLVKSLTNSFSSAPDEPATTVPIPAQRDEFPALTPGRTVSNLNVPGVPLTLQVFNPGNTRPCPVTSTLIIGKTEVALVDTQFGKSEAEDLVKLIKSSGKKLILVYISHENADCYFGSEVIHKAFPECPIYAIRPTIKQIENTKDEMLAIWLPILGQNAPQNIIVPRLLENRKFFVDGHEVQILESTSRKSYCWVPSMNAVLGGFAVFGSNVHLWLVNDKTSDSRTDWYHVLTTINNHYPDIIVPSHFYPGASFDVLNVEFTQQYLSEVERRLPLTNSSADFVNVMDRMYPQLHAKSNLVISAQVLKGEIEWPR